jgi:arylformamidase
MPVYPGDPPVRLERFQSIADGADANVSVVELSAHAGTHVDAPLHYLPEGAGVDCLPLGALVGPATVVDVSHARTDVGPELVSRLSAGSSRILLKTRGSAEVTPEAAAELVVHGAVLVGIDALTIGNDTVHRTLLAAGIVIVESLDLSAAQPGAYTLVCLPLKLAGADGAPARAVLLTSDT